MTISKNRAVGIFFTVIGAGVFWAAVATLKIGAPAQMGPGFFPALISAILFCFGVALSFSPSGDERIDLSDIPWRGIFFVCISVVTFAATFRVIGFVASTATMVLLASMASRRMNLRLALILSVSITAICTLIFIYGVGLSYPL